MRGTRAAGPRLLGMGGLGLLLGLWAGRLHGSGAWWQLGFGSEWVRVLGHTVLGGFCAMLCACAA